MPGSGSMHALADGHRREATLAGALGPAEDAEHVELLARQAVLLAERLDGAA